MPPPEAVVELFLLQLVDAPAKSAAMPTAKNNPIPLMIEASLPQYCKSWPRIKSSGAASWQLSPRTAKFSSEIGV
jgi:hypothetical protein